MAAARIPQMNWATDNHKEALQLFKSNISVYCEDEEITDNRKKALKILRGIGDEGTRRLQLSGLSEDKRKPDKLWEFFESQLKPKINFRVHRLHLMECRQREDETLDDFILRVRTLAMMCEFDQTEMEERLIELIIASTPLEDFQRDLLGKAKGYKLADALAEGRRYQAGRSKLQQLNPSTGELKLDLLSNKQAQKSRSCGNCNTSHEPRKCPAFERKDTGEGHSDREREKIWLVHQAAIAKGRPKRERKFMTWRRRVRTRVMTTTSSMILSTSSAFVMKFSQQWMLWPQEKRARHRLS